MVSSMCILIYNSGGETYWLQEMETDIFVSLVPSNMAIFEGLYNTAFTTSLFETKEHKLFSSNL